MSSDPYIGEIMLWPISYAPQGWAFCDGSIMQAAQNQALFALLGNIYGGDGYNTFALPDLRGRIVVGAGQGLGLTRRDLGTAFGVENVSFSVTQLPELTGDPAGSALTLPGGQASIPISPPQLAVNYVIAINGYWPSRW